MGNLREHSNITLQGKPVTVYTLESDNSVQMSVPTFGGADTSGKKGIEIPDFIKRGYKSQDTSEIYNTDAEVVHKEKGLDFSDFTQMGIINPNSVVDTVEGMEPAINQNGLDFSSYEKFGIINEGHADETLQCNELHNKMLAFLDKDSKDADLPNYKPKPIEKISLF